MSKNKEIQENNVKELQYSKEEILRSNKFAGIEKDLLNVLIGRDKKYTLEQCNQLLEKENERVIK